MEIDSGKTNLNTRIELLTFAGARSRWFMAESRRGTYLSIYISISLYIYIYLSIYLYLYLD